RRVLFRSAVYSASRLQKKRFLRGSSSYSRNQCLRRSFVTRVTCGYSSFLHCLTCTRILFTNSVLYSSTKSFTSKASACLLALEGRIVSWFGTNILRSLIISV